MSNVIEFNKAIEFKENLKETAAEEHLFDTLDSLLDHVEDVADHGIVIIVKNNRLISGSTQMHSAQVREMLDLAIKDLEVLDQERGPNKDD
jgi:hypothetical protein